ncbi:acetyl-coenzyme A synthetase N-terminal domain-containing protein, partial [Roseobacter weihaiensis]|uniref:acetyl-coenzyme A synthetase N-terminal domain-containing protein n=1 Tax=Roseobacter weihaiensis TaxID=2763262 RepID=UPI001D0B8EF6
MPDTAKTSSRTYPPSAEMAANAHVNAHQYEEMYATSLTDSEGFWGAQGDRVAWMRRFTQVKDV